MGPPLSMMVEGNALLAKWMILLSNHRDQFHTYTLCAHQLTFIKQTQCAYDNLVDTYMTNPMGI